jgi:hypothetical protein
MNQLYKIKIPEHIITVLNHIVMDELQGPLTTDNSNKDINSADMLIKKAGLTSELSPNRAGTLLTANNLNKVPSVGSQGFAIPAPKMVE